MSDLVEGIFRLSTSDMHEPVNIGNPSEMSIREFGEAIIKRMKTSSKLEFKPLPIDDPRVRQPDISLARKVLDWEPLVDFDTGISETIDYFRKFIESA